MDGCLMVIGVQSLIVLGACRFEGNGLRLRWTQIFASQVSYADGEPDAYRDE